MVWKKSKITLLSIIAVLIMSAVSMFVYGCFCLNKKGSDGADFTTTEIPSGYTQEFVETNAGKTHPTMGWSSSDWAWSGNDDYGLPNGLPVPRVFMTTTYNVQVCLDSSCTICGGVDGGDVTTGGGQGAGNGPYTVSFFKGTSLSVDGSTSASINYGGATVATATAGGGYVFVKWTQSGSNIYAHFRPKEYKIYYHAGWDTLGSIKDWQDSGIKATSNDTISVVYNDSYRGNDYAVDFLFKKNGANVVQAHSAGYVHGNHVIYNIEYQNNTQNTAARTFNATSGKVPSDYYNDGDVIIFDVFYKSVTTNLSYVPQCSVSGHGAHGGSVSKSSYSGMPKGYGYSTSGTTLSIAGTNVKSARGSDGSQDTEAKSDSVTATVATGYTFGSWIQNGDTFTAKFNKIDYSVKTYTNDGPADTGYTYFGQTNYYICSGSKNLPSLPGATSLYSATAWKIGPFNASSQFVHDTSYTWDRSTKRFSGSNVNVQFASSSEISTTEGTYFIIRSISTNTNGSVGSYGSIDKLGNKPVITPLWERTATYNVYYNDTDAPTFHTSGSSGLNNYHVTVKKDTDNVIVKDANTEDFQVSSTDSVTLAGINLSTDSEATITIGSTTISYICTGYKFIGFRYAFINPTTVLTNINGASGSPITLNNLRGWQWVDAWKTNGNKGTIASLSGDTNNYAICVQPVVELIPYTATFNTQCTVSGHGAHGGSLTGANNANKITFGEAKTASITVNNNVIGNLVRGVTLTASVNVVTFTSCTINVGTMTANCATSAGTALYTFNSWGGSFDAIVNSNRTGLVAKFTPVDFNINTYYNISPDGDYTNNVENPYIICGGTKGLKGTGTDATLNIKYEFNGLELYQATSWKIGPFNASSQFVHDTNYTWNRSTNRFSNGSTVNVQFASSSEISTTEGTYFIISSISTNTDGSVGSYGSIDKLGDNPVITPLWERTDNFLLYYNDVTKPTFHSAGVDGVNGFNVQVSGEGSSVVHVSPTKVNELKTNDKLVFDNVGATGTDVGVDLFLNSDTGNKIANYQENGYRITRFRYALIGLGTNISYINDEASSWSQYNSGTVFNTLSSTAYAICVQPVVELISYTATINVKCDEHSAYNQGGFVQGTIGVNTIKVSESTSQNITVTNAGQQRSIVVGNLVRGVTFSLLGEVITVYNCDTSKKPVGTVTAYCETKDSVQLYTFNNWGGTYTAMTNANRNDQVANFTPVVFSATGYYAVDGGVPTSASSTKLATYTFCKTNDSNFENLTDIKNAHNEVVKYFKGWQIGPFNSSNQFKHDTSYRATINGNVLTFGKTGLKVQFNLKTVTSPSTNPVVDINGDIYYLLADVEIKNGHAYDNGNYGNLNLIDGKPVVIARWASIYDLTVKNDGGNYPIWNGTAQNNEYELLGIKYNINSIDGKAYELQLKVDNASAESNYKFITSPNTAFYKLGDTDKTTNNSTTKGDDFFGIFNYGYVVDGWYVNFTKVGESRPFYVYFDGIWKYDNTGAVHKITNQQAESLSIGGYAGLLDDLYTAGIADTSSIYLTITPIWTPSNIKVMCEGSNKVTTPSSNIISYNNDYVLQKTTNPTGQEFGYYINDDDIIATSGKWNYYALTWDQIPYNEDNGLYEIIVDDVFVDNIYRINLSGVKKNPSTNAFDFIAGENGAVHNYGEAYATNKYSGDKYTYLDTGYNYGTYDSGWIEEFTPTILAKITEYNEAIESAEHYLLRKVYDDGLTVDKDGNEIYNAHIYLAHNQTIGYLPIYDHSNYELIFWEYVDDDVDNKNYIYKTTLFDNSESGHGDDAQDKTDRTSERWEYDDKIVELQAHYYRKYYYLKPQVAENNEIGQFGYLIMTTTDEIETGAEAKNFKYLAIALNDGSDYIMRYFDITGYDDFTLKDLTHSDGQFVDEKPFVEGMILKYKGVELNNISTLEGIKVYSGCTVQFDIYDQSKDILAMQSGHYDDMIGYRFRMNSVVKFSANDGSQSDQNLEDTTLTDYVYMIAYDEDEDPDTDPIGKQLNYVNGDSMTFTFDFERIHYGVTVKMNNNDAGSFTLITKKGTQADKTTYTINTTDQDSLVIGDTIIIRYNANLGYDLDQDALRLLVNGSSVELTLETRKIENENIVQEWVIEITGTWLRENYYFYAPSSEYKDFEVDDADLGDVSIYTVSFDFDYIISLIDSNNVAIGEIDNGTWNTSQDNLDLDVFTQLSMITGQDIYAIDYSSVKYAPINSYFANYLGATNIASKDYEFPMLANVISSYEMKDYIKYLFNYGTIIIPEDQREIVTMMVVEPINIIEISDLSDQDREIVISNNSNGISTNSVTFEASANVDNPVKIHSYKGLENRIELVAFDEVIYDGATFVVNSTNSDRVYYKNEVYNFSVEQNSEVTLEWNKAKHYVNVKYFIDGNLQASRPVQLKDAVGADLTKNGSILEYVYLGDLISANYELKNSEIYSIKIEIGSKTYIDDEMKAILIEREFLNDTYMFDLNVMIREKSNTDLTFIFKLLDNSQARVGDNFGTFDIKLDGRVEASVAGAQNSAEIQIYENSSLKIDFSQMNAGYEYYGYKYNSGSIVTDALVGNVLTISDSYVIPNTIGNIYYIYLKKIVYNVNFINSEGGNYALKVNGNALNAETTAIIGDVVTIEGAETDRERFVSNYYLKNNESANKIHFVGTTAIVDSTKVTGLTDEITFGVDTERYYEVVFKMNDSSMNFLSSFSAGTIDNSIHFDLNNPQFVPSGQIRWEVTPKVANKYIVTYSINGGNASESNIVQTMINSDAEIVLEIVPRKYQVTIDSNVTDSQVENLLNGQMFDYGTEQVMSITLENSKFFLNHLEVEGNDGALVELEISKQGGIKIAGTADNAVRVNSIVVEDYVFSIVGTNLQIKTVVKNNINLDLTYINLINISPNDM